MVDIFKPIEFFADVVVYKLIGMGEGVRLANALHFFIYDTIKIFILLLVISFIVGVAKSYLTPEVTRKFLSGKMLGVGNVLAACLGIVTPFCSCSACPLFIGLIEAGVPLGVTFSYLIAAPMINEVAIVVLLGLFGFKIAGLYIFSGLIIAIASGLIIGTLNLERFVEDFIQQGKKISCACSCNDETPSFKSKLEDAKESAWDIFSRTWIYIVIGVGIGAFIHNYVPTDFLVKYAGRENPFAVLVAVLLGVPLYANIAGILPIAEVLVKQGLPIGTILAFTMATTAISLPEMMILKRVLKMPLLAIFVAILTVAIIFTGYLFNAVI